MHRCLTCGRDLLGATADHQIVCEQQRAMREGRTVSNVVAAEVRLTNVIPFRPPAKRELGSVA